MAKNKFTNLICIVVTIAMLLGTVGLLTAYVIATDQTDSSDSGKDMAYENDLFDDSTVHTVNIVINKSDWNDLLDGAESKNYYACDLVIDGNAVQNVAIRAKGNTSLKQVSSYGNNRYSLKIEFDHYQDGKTYEGLDKLALNNLIQDNTCMKDYLTYKMMAAMGAEAPECSFIHVKVNGKDWGLYLAVEGIEDSFSQRNYGSDTDQIYKPDFEEAGGQGNSSDVLKLQYSDDNTSSYEEIFDSALFSLTSSQKTNLIQSLKTLNSGKNLEDALDVDEVIRYFVVHNFVLNGDSYTGSMLHNYYLHESNTGQLSMIAWDYNLAFGGFSAGSGTSGNSATSLVNYPIDTPLLGSSLKERPMISWIFNSNAYTKLYHQYFDQFLSTCFESGWFNKTFKSAYNLIAPYIKEDDNGFVSYDDFVTACDTLKSFVNLRNKSIRGQLDGTIPSTENGQTADNSSLIDASSLSINTMGSNGGGTAKSGQQTKSATTGTKGTNTTTSNTHQSSTTAKDTSADSDQGTVALLKATTSKADTSDTSGTTTQKATSSSDADSSSSAPSKDGKSFGGQQMPGNFYGGKGGNQNSSTNQSNTGDIRNILILSGTSVVLLVAAILLVYRYKRRKF